MGRRASIPRCALVWLLVTASVVGVVRWLAGDVIRPSGLISSGELAEAQFDELLTRLAAVIVVACALWFWLVTTLVTVEAALASALASGLTSGLTSGLGATRMPRAGCPEGIRRLLLAACGLVLASGLATPATAGAGRAHVPPPGVTMLAGLPLPERATSQATSAMLASPSIRTIRTIGSAPPRRNEADHPRMAPAPYRTVRVRVGDTLWSLAASALSPGAGEAKVAAAWGVIYAHNQAVIGADPDLILPGTTLSIPDIQEESR